MGLFFSADTHWGHGNIIKFDALPFISIEEHDEVLLANWNRTVGPDDDVWHLGDFCYRNKMPVERYLERLNGRIHLVKGNHDDKGAWKVRDKFASFQEAAYIRHEGECIYMLHYACRVWRKSNHGSWHLYGHSHGSLPPLGRSMDVGVAAVAKMLGGKLEDYRPISFEEVRTVIISQKVEEKTP
jgi:calcineurin-like phosphoesterase family protein